MSGRDQLARFAAQAGAPRDADGPVFAEPWQAEAFALTVRLHESGCFSWSDWASALADVLKEIRDRGETGDGSRYYEHWLVALERLVTAKGLLTAGQLAARKDAWIEAYETTPHGQPVALNRTPEDRHPG